VSKTNSQEIRNHARQIAGYMAARFYGMWGFVDGRIQAALIDAQILSHLQLQDDETIANWSGKRVLDVAVYLQQEVATQLATKHRMPIDEM
jgi:hypothetical protein